MKCACDRCEKVITTGSEEYENTWRRLLITKPEDFYRRGLEIGFGNSNMVLLCDKCFDEVVDFANHDLYKPVEKT